MSQALLARADGRRRMARLVARALAEALAEA
jgi:hypothetical protein